MAINEVIERKEKAEGDVDNISHLMKCLLKKQEKVGFLYRKRRAGRLPGKKAKLLGLDHGQ